MSVYKGEQTFAEWQSLCAQGLLFERRITDRDVAQSRLNVIAIKVVSDLGRNADDFELRETIKGRFAGRGVYDSAMVAIALDAARRERKRL